MFCYVLLCFAMFLLCFAVFLLCFAMLYYVLLCFCFVFAMILLCFCYVLAAFLLCFAMFSLWFLEALEGLKCSGRLVGTICTIFHPDPSSCSRVVTKHRKT